MIKFKKQTKKQKLIEREISQSLQDGIKKEAMRREFKKLKGEIKIVAKECVKEARLIMNNTCYHNMPTLDDKFMRIGDA